MLVNLVPDLKAWSDKTGSTFHEPAESSKPYSLTFTTAAGMSYFIDVLPRPDGIVVQHGNLCDGRRLNNGVLRLPPSANVGNRLDDLKSAIEGDEELKAPRVESSRDWYRKASPKIASAGNFKF